MSPRSAIPDFYYFCFGAYEPFLTTIGFLGTLVYVQPAISFMYSSHFNFFY